MIWTITMLGIFPTIEVGQLNIFLADMMKWKEL